MEVFFIVLGGIIVFGFIEGYKANEVRKRVREDVARWREEDKKRGIFPTSSYSSPSIVEQQMLQEQREHNQKMLYEQQEIRRLEEKRTAIAEKDWSISGWGTKRNVK